MAPKAATVGLASSCRGGDSDIDTKQARRPSSSAAVLVTAAVEAFEFAFKTGNADFDLEARVRGFDFAGAGVDEKNDAASVVAPLSVSVLAKWGTRRLAMPLVGWGSLSAEKKAR